MDTSFARRFYNAVGVSERSDPECAESRFAVDRVHTQLARVIKPGMRVLDPGCNAGRFVFAAEDLGAKAVGIDCAVVPLEHACEVAERRGSRARFVLGDYRALPFPPVSFDAILFMHNIVECSYDDVDSLLHQVKDILSPGGLFCLSMPDRLAQHQQNGRSLADYDRSTGRREHVSYVTDDGEEIVVPSYFWTVFFARFICSRHLTPLSEERLPGGDWWAVWGRVDSE